MGCGAIKKHKETAKKKKQNARTSKTSSQDDFSHLSADTDPISDHLEDAEVEQEHSTALDNGEEFVAQPKTNTRAVTFTRSSRKAHSQPPSASQRSSSQATTTSKTNSHEGKHTGVAGPESRRPMHDAALGVVALCERLNLDEENGSMDDEAADLPPIDEYEDSFNDSELQNSDDDIGFVNLASDNDGVIKTIPKLVNNKAGAQKKMMKGKEARAKRTESDSDDMDDDEPFNFTVEVIDATKGNRTMEIMSSTKAWLSVQNRVAEILNIYPTSIHLQYRFSTQLKSLPCDLTSERHFNTMLSLLRPLIVPPTLANGRRSTRAMKAVTVHIFNKEEEPQLSGSGKNHGGSAKQSQKLGLAKASEKPKTEAEEFHTQRVAAWKEITAHFGCPIHSLPDKQVLCWKDPVQQMCYPISESNLNWWATVYMSQLLSGVPNLF